MENLIYNEQGLAVGVKDVEKIDWVKISKHQKLSEEFIREFQYKVWWKDISRYQKLSEDFIRAFKDEVCWVTISRYQKLSETFIREFKDKVYWWNISRYQNISEEFIREVKEKMKCNSTCTIKKERSCMIENNERIMDAKQARKLTDIENIRIEDYAIKRINENITRETNKGNSCAVILFKEIGMKNDIERRGSLVQEKEYRLLIEEIRTKGYYIEPILHNSIEMGLKISW